MKSFRLFIIAIFIAGIVFASPKDAQVTQVYVENVTLEELIRISDCIIVAKKSNPFTIIERIGITPPGKTPNKITFTDFTKVTYNFEVVKVMYLQQDDQDYMERSLAVGKILIVRPAAQDVAFEMHKNSIWMVLGNHGLRELITHLRYLMRKTY